MSCSSRDERRLRSCSSCLSAEVRLGHGGQMVPDARSATRIRAQRSSTHLFFPGTALEKPVRIASKECREDWTSRPPHMTLEMVSFRIDCFQSSRC